MATKISILNFKGGVGKTTTTLNLGAALSLLGKRVLVIDLDSQRNLSPIMGYHPGDGETVFDALSTKGGELTIYGHDRMKNLFFVPADKRLTGIDISLFNRSNREHILDKLLKKEEEDYDFILIDCPPKSLTLNKNAMVASDYLIIPIDCKVFSIQGMGDIFEELEEIKSDQDLNPKLQIMGYLLTMYDSRTKLSKEVERNLKRNYPERVFRTKIHINTRLSETPGYNLNIFEYDPESTGAEDYMSLAEEITGLKRKKKWKEQLKKYIVKELKN